MSNSMVEPNQIQESGDVDQLTEFAAHHLCKLWGSPTHNSYGDQTIELINARQAMASWRLCEQAFKQALSEQHDELTEIFNDG